MGITRAERDNLRPKNVKEYIKRTEPPKAEKAEGTKIKKKKKKSKGQKKEGKIFLHKDLSLSNLTNNIDKFIQQGVSISLWGGERQNKKLDIQNDKIMLMNGYMHQLKEIGLNLSEIKVNDIFSKTFIKKMVNFKAEELEKGFKLEFEKIKTEIAQQESTRNKLDFDKKAKKKYLKKIDTHLEKLENENALTEQDIKMKEEKVKLMSSVIKKLNDGSIKDMPMEILHEIFNFFNESDGSNIEAIARYQKTLSDMEKNRAEAMNINSDSMKKVSESNAKDLETMFMYEKFKQNQKDGKN